LFLVQKMGAGQRLADWAVFAVADIAAAFGNAALAGIHIGFAIWIVWLEWKD